MKPQAKTLAPELLREMDAWWRAANYLSVGQIYLSRRHHPHLLTDAPVSVSTRSGSGFNIFTIASMPWIYAVTHLQSPQSAEKAISMSPMKLIALRRASLLASRR